MKAILLPISYLSKDSCLEERHFLAQASLAPEFIKEACEWDAKDRGGLRVDYRAIYFQRESAITQKFHLRTQV